MATGSLPEELAHRQWRVEDLWLSLQPHWPGISVELLAEVDSTNTCLMERARLAASSAAPDDESQEATLLVAQRQTAGRGRLGRHWHAREGASLTASLALPLAPADWSGLSLVVGLALAQALHPSVRIKWPNDLWLMDESQSVDAPGARPAAGRKLGGILIETLALPGRARLAVIGFGLNITPDGAPEPMVTDSTRDVAGPLSSGYACVQEFWPGASPSDVLHRVAAPLLQALRRFELEGLAPSLADYAQRDALRGREIIAFNTALTASADASPVMLAGLCEGIDASGALRLREASGLVHAVHSGEVSIRLNGLSGTVGGLQ